MAKPVLLAVDDDRDILAVLGRDLGRRFGADYRIVTADAPQAALAMLGATDQVALLVAGQRLRNTTGVDFLCLSHELYPSAKRMLLITYGDIAGGRAGLSALALGQLDQYVNKPWGDPELELYPAVEVLLSQWARATVAVGSRPEMLRIVGPQWSARSHELRDLLTRNSISHGFYDADRPEGRQLLAQAGVPASDRPIVLLFDGRVLVDPPNQRIAEVLGAQTEPTAGRYDITVVGGGPAGLTAAMYAASEGLRTLLLEREAIGGQAGTTSMIRNYLGFPRGISGGELAARAAEQAMLMGAEMVFVQTAAGLGVRGSDRRVSLTDGSQVQSRTVVIATGVTYRRLAVPGLDKLLGAGVFYGAAVTEAQALQGQPAHVVGGANSAGQAAVHLASYAEQVTLLVRSPTLSAGMSTYLIREIERMPNINVRLHTSVTGVHGHGRLEALSVHDAATDQTETLPAAGLFVLIGADPHTTWLAETVERDQRGFLLTGRDLLRDGQPPQVWPLQRSPLPLETSMPGVFAAGDVRRGSVKRVASAVGEGAAAVQQIHQYLNEP